MRKGLGKLLLQEPSHFGPPSWIPQKTRGNGGLAAVTNLPDLADPQWSADHGWATAGLEKQR